MKHAFSLLLVALSLMPVCWANEPEPWILVNSGLDGGAEIAGAVRELDGDLRIVTTEPLAGWLMLSMGDALPPTYVLTMGEDLELDSRWVEAVMDAGGQLDVTLITASGVDLLGSIAVQGGSNDPIGNLPASSSPGVGGANAKKVDDGNPGPGQGTILKCTKPVCTATLYLTSGQQITVTLKKDDSLYLSPSFIVYAVCSCS